MLDSIPYVYIIFVLDSTLTYLLYFLVCVVGILDIAKQYLLQEQLDITALLFCLVNMIQQVYTIEVYNKLMPLISNNFYFWIGIDMVSTIAIAYILYP